VIVALEELLTEMRFVEEEIDSDGEDASEESDLEASLVKAIVYVKAYRECKWHRFTFICLRSSQIKSQV